MEWELFLHGSESKGQNSEELFLISCQLLYLNFGWLFGFPQHMSLIIWKHFQRDSVHFYTNHGLRTFDLFCGEKKREADE